MVSHTLERADWSNSTILSGELAEQVAALKSEAGGDILVAGSATLVRELLARDLVDELRLMVFPIVLGGGKRLFGDDPEARALKLVDCRPLESGTVIVTYHRA